MKGKKTYLKVTVTQANGNTFENPLKLSEVHLINKLLSSNESVKVQRIITYTEYYNVIFGK